MPIFRHHRYRLSKPFQRNVSTLFPVERTITQLLAVIEKTKDERQFFSWDGRPSALVLHETDAATVKPPILVPMIAISGVWADAQLSILL